MSVFIITPFKVSKMLSVINFMILQSKFKIETDSADCWIIIHWQLLFQINVLLDKTKPLNEMLV